MESNTVVITGATGGIGKATAHGLALLGAHVIIVGRDPQRTEEAARAIRRSAGGKVDAFSADLSSQAQVRRLAGELLSTLPRIDVLINNAGGYWNTRHTTVDGIEHALALNHLAPFLLTNLLLERLHLSGPARVITVSSKRTSHGAHQL
ncbi:SDR family NAD(P)-dependent oxidoreductase [Pseudarthrobacter scleromae]|uniref:SDR family NAD(P)-dependent oxidoreductase n=1 Tax=Pseudarthrobacter scleromae TaxID=158897 RepID=UPI0036417BE1